MKTEINTTLFRLPSKTPESLPSNFQSKLRAFELEETSGKIYARYGAIHSASNSKVWVHHFTNIDAEKRTEFDARLRQMHRIQLPGLVRTYFHQFCKDELYLVTERVQGARLDFLLDTVAPIIAEFWANQLSEILGNLHEVGILHGHLSPHAIYRTTDGLKIVGAGLAELWEPVWEASNSKGTISPRRFVAPEVRLDGIGNAKPSADVYSLGAILYSAYTRQCPGEICIIPSRKADVPCDVDRAVMMSLNADPRHRQQSLKEFIDSFYGSSSQVSETVEPFPEPEPPERSFNRYRRHKRSNRVKRAASWSVCVSVLAFACMWGLKKIERVGERKIAEAQSRLNDTFGQKRWEFQAFEWQSDRSSRRVDGDNVQTEESARIVLPTTTDDGSTRTQEGQWRYFVDRIGTITESVMAHKDPDGIEDNFNNLNQLWQGLTYAVTIWLPEQFGSEDNLESGDSHLEEFESNSERDDSRFRPGGGTMLRTQSYAPAFFGTASTVSAGS